MKKIFSVFLILILMLSHSLTAYAKSPPSLKEEVIYGILTPSGDVENIYAVNIFSDTNITDYGDYIKV